MLGPTRLDPWNCSSSKQPRFLKDRNKLCSADFLKIPFWRSVIQKPLLRSPNDVLRHELQPLRDHTTRVLSDLESLKARTKSTDGCLRMWWNNTRRSTEGPKHGREVRTLSYIRSDDVGSLPTVQRDLIVHYPKHRAGIAGPSESIGIPELLLLWHCDL